MKGPEIKTTNTPTVWTVVSEMVKKMNNSDFQSNDIFKPLTEPEIVKVLPKQVASNALSMVLDAINSSPGGLIITDLNGIIQFANPAFCKQFDYLLSEIIGRYAADFFSSDGIMLFEDLVEIMKNGCNETEEFTVEKKDGRRFVVEVAASNVTTVSGEVAGRMASFINITRRKEIEADRKKLIQKLQEALDNIKVLKGIIPICASCKKIRDDKGDWKQIESYIKDHSDADFSHGMCPECAKNLYPEFFK